MATLEELIHQKRWNEAAGLGHKLIEKYPNNSALHYHLGLARFQLGDPTGAIQALRSAERSGLSSAALHKTLGLAYYDLHQFLLFEQQMEKAIALDPRDSESYYCLGRYHEAIKSDFPRALKFFEAATQKKPEDARSVYHRGYCMEMLGEQEDARESYKAAIQLVEKSGEDFSEPYQGMARLLLGLHPQQALSWAQKALDINPDDGANYLVLAKIKERLGRLPDAVETLKAALRLDPTDATAHYRLYRLYERLGNREAALAELKAFEGLNAVYGTQ